MWCEDIDSTELGKEIYVVPCKIERLVKSLLLDVQRVMEREKDLSGIDEESSDQPLYKLMTNFTCTFDNILQIKCKEVSIL